MSAGSSSKTMISPTRYIGCKVVGDALSPRALKRPTMIESVNKQETVGLKNVVFSAKDVSPDATGTCPACRGHNV